MTYQAANSVLVVDDEPGMRLALSAEFRREGWSVETAAGAYEALNKFEKGHFPLVVTDVRMPDGDGLHVMQRVRSSKPATAVIVLTAFGTVPEAVQAMRGGACDYLTKPISSEQLQAAVRRVMKEVRTPSIPAKSQANPIVGKAPALLRELDRARQAAKTGADVLIEAESGTGKELLARFVHDNSERRNRPFIAVNCAAVPEHLLESELFGHLRGAFTGASANKVGKFELAEGGTLLLDEIGEMPVSLQPKLLRALQEREFEKLGDTRTVRVNIRVIATTNVPLYRMVEEGRFRADLFYRLNVIPLSLPPLRERQDDIPELADHFVRRYASELGLPVPAVHPEFLAGLQRHAWPGNVRELANFIRRVITMHAGGELGADCLRREGLGQEKSLHPVLTSGTSIRDLERSLLETTLERTGGNRTRAAEMLGLSVRTIRNRIRQYGLPPRRFA